MKVITDVVDSLLFALCLVFIVLCLFVIRETYLHGQAEQKRKAEQDAHVSQVYSGREIPKCDLPIWVRITDGCEKDDEVNSNE